VLVSLTFSLVLLLDSFSSGLTHIARALLSTLFLVNNADTFVSCEAKKEVLKFEDAVNDENGDDGADNACVEGRLIAYGSCTMLTINTRIINTNLIMTK
jgi:hypothetical protein